MASRFVTTERLGPIQGRTREGFLICEGVPIARTGEMLYREGELGQLQAGKDGLIHVHRDEEEVFAEDSIRSFEGKPIVTHTHPPGKKVTPQNARQLKVGHVQNVRRGDGDRSNLLLADLIFHTEDAIELVRNKTLRDLSAGYDARYQQIAPGIAVQRYIHGNHVALVPEGRAGLLCSIGDAQPMTTLTFRQKLLNAFRGGNADEFHTALAEVPDAPVVQATVVPIATADEVEADAGEKRIKALEDKLADLMGRFEDMEDDIYGEEEKTGDQVTIDAAAEAAAAAAAAALAANPTIETTDAEMVLQDIRAKAEILVPGYTITVGDSAAATADDLVAERRIVLAIAMNNDITREHVSAFMRPGMTVPTLTGDQVMSVFDGAAELSRRLNNGKTIEARRSVGQPAVRRPMTLEEINEANQKYWDKQRDVK